MTYGEGGVDHLVVGNFEEINKEFKQLIANTALFAGQTKDATNMAPANWTDVGKYDATQLIRKRFKVLAIGCMAARRGAQNELLIKRLQFILNSPIAATQVAKAGPPRGCFYEYGNSTFNDRGNCLSIQQLSIIQQFVLNCYEGGRRKEKTTNKRKNTGKRKKWKTRHNNLDHKIKIQLIRNTHSTKKYTHQFNSM